MIFRMLEWEDAEVFRSNLLAEMKRQGLDKASLSKKASMNPRAVSDIQDGKSKSPRLFTAIKLARVLNVSVYDLLGIPTKDGIILELEKYLSEKTEDEQARILSGIQTFLEPPSS